jgi:hypothetical protein
MSYVYDRNAPDGVARQREYVTGETTAFSRTEFPPSGTENNSSEDGITTSVVPGFAYDHRNGCQPSSPGRGGVILSESRFTYDGLNRRIIVAVNGVVTAGVRWRQPVGSADGGAMSLVLSTTARSTAGHAIGRAKDGGIGGPDGLRPTYSTARPDRQPHDDDSFGRISPRPARAR